MGCVTLPSAVSSRFFQFCCILTTSILVSGQARAEDFSLNFSGFGTVGVVHSTAKEADFSSVGDQPNGAGHTRDWDFNPDSKLGLQLDAKLGSTLSAAIQGLARQRYDNSIRSAMMFGFLRWQALPEITIRAGRMPTPAFLISDYRFVGYAITPVRAPADMYYLFFFHYFNGLDITWKSQIYGVPLQVQAFGGKTKVPMPENQTFGYSAVFGGNMTAYLDDLTLRLSVMTGKSEPKSEQFDNFFQGLRFGFPPNALGPGSPPIPGDPQLADRYSINPKYSRVVYPSIGFNYDPGNWLLTGEMSVSNAFFFYTQHKFWYLTGGVRIGNFTPYATISRLSTRKFKATGNPAFDEFRGRFLNIGQRTIAVGVRWDATKNTALKVQFDHSQPNSGSTGVLFNTQPNYRPGSSYNLFTTSVDFVF